MSKIDYPEYLRSPRWQMIRRVMLERYKVCRRCDFPYELNVHHKTYERLGSERIPDDLEVLCRACHSRHHFLENITEIDLALAGVETLGELRNRIETAIGIAKEKNVEREDEVRQNVERDDGNT